jgi:hypothetical protein
MVLLGCLSESRRNIGGFSCISLQAPIDCLDVASDHFGSAVEDQETVGVCTSPIIHTRIQSTELPHPKRAWNGLSNSAGFELADSSEPTIDTSCRAWVDCRYEFFLAQSLSWVIRGEKLLLPNSPRKPLLKVPIV